jgi:hypothetical protein
MQVGKWLQFEGHLESTANFLGLILQTLPGSNWVASLSREKKKITSIKNLSKYDCIWTLLNIHNKEHMIILYKIY